MTDIYETARTLFARHRRNEAMELIEYGLNESPDEGRLWELKGLIHRVQSELVDCEQALSRARSLMELQPLGLVALADCYRCYGKRYIARQLYLTALDQSEQMPEALAGITEGLGATEEWGLAIGAARAWCAADPADGYAWFSLGIALGRVDGDEVEILEAARTAIALAPDRLDYRVGLATLLHERSWNEEAYALVCEFSEYDLVIIRCACSLRRLQSLYFAMRDWKRSEWCRRLRRE